MSVRNGKDEGNEKQTKLVEGKKGKARQGGCVQCFKAYDDRKCRGKKQHRELGIIPRS